MEQKGDDFRALKILHLALLGGLTMLSIILLLLRITDAAANKQDEDFEQILQVVAVVLSLGCLLIGYNKFKNKVAAARNSVETGEIKMAQYRAACITWWATIDGPGIFAAISFFLTGNYAFFALALFHLSLLAVFMPRKENIILLLNLTSDEVSRLEGKL